MISQGDGAPRDVHPDELHNGHGTRLHTAQFLPRLSKEAQENIQKYRELEEAFQEIWQYQHSMVCGLQLCTSFSLNANSQLGRKVFT